MPARPRRPIGTLVALLLALAAAVIVACGDDDGGGGSQSGSTEENDTLIVANTADVGADLDARTVGNTPGRSLMLEMYEGLVSKSYYGEGEGLEIQPALAESWEVSPDKLTYTFKIREGVKFHDGTPLNAEAIEFSLRTVIDPKFEHYYEKGAATAATVTAPIASVEATDEYTLELKVKEPAAQLLDGLSMPANSWIVSPAAIKKHGNEGIANNPVGTGPYEFVKYRPGSLIELRRNKDYWRGPAGFETLIYRPITDAAARASAMEAGEVQIAEGVPINTITSWENRDDINTIISPRLRMHECFFNYVKDTPLKDKRFREALSLGSDREAMSAIAFDGNAVPSNGYYIEGTAPYPEGRDPFPTDVERAKQIIQENGWEGTQLTMLIAPGLGEQSVWDTWAENMRAIGVNVKLQSVDVTEWVAVHAEGTGADSRIDGLCVAGGSDNFWLFANWTSSVGFPENGTQNPGRYTHPPVEAAFEQAQAAESNEEYFEGLKQANIEVGDDYGLLFLISDLHLLGISPNLEWEPPLGTAMSYYSAKPAGGE